MKKIQLCKTTVLNAVLFLLFICFVNQFFFSRENMYEEEGMEGEGEFDSLHFLSNNFLNELFQYIVFTKSCIQLHSQVVTNFCSFFLFWLFSFRWGVGWWRWVKYLCFSHHINKWLCFFCFFCIVAHFMLLNSFKLVVHNISMLLKASEKLFSTSEKSQSVSDPKTKQTKKETKIHYLHSEFHMLLN